MCHGWALFLALILLLMTHAMRYEICLKLFYGAAAGAREKAKEEERKHHHHHHPCIGTFSGTVCVVHGLARVPAMISYA